MMKVDVIKEANKHNIKVEFIDWGIAFRLKDKMYMNKDLVKYDIFCKSVLHHELQHTGEVNKKNFKKDFILDFFGGSIYDNLSFCIKHPRGFIQMLPIHHFQKTWLVDINQIIMYCLGTGLLCAFIFLL